VVWIHDYNLWLVPGLVRRQRPDLKIAFFLHTPFPGPDVFGILPWRIEILESLLSCDRLGFHIPRYAQNFVACARALCGATSSHRISASDLLSQPGSVLHEPQFVTEMAFKGQRTHIDAIPLGINAPLIHQIRERVGTRKRSAQIREELAVDTVILSVGRVDYTKGIVELLEAYERLLSRRAELSGRVKLVLTCVPPASGIEVYDDIQRDIEQRVGAINGRYSTLAWTPILLFTQPFRFEELVAWYAAADICWITPLRDGLNLVAKEYVVAKGGKAGVLVLSDFAGSVIELDEAIHCNPYSSRNMDASLDRALSTSFEEAAHHSHLMFRRVCRNSIGHWTSEMMRRLGLVQARRPAP
jgi:glucosylglycerol-phosphate synthase